VTAHDTARDALAEAQNRLTRALLIEPGDVAELIGAIKDQAEALACPLGSLGDGR
jgi:hypothetical protein